jgi:epoxyqueuosine reductase
VRASVDLVWLLQLSREEYLQAFRGSAIRRAKVWMLRRNAAVALGNVGGAEDLEPLARAMKADDHPVVRGHAAWAVGRLGGRLGVAEAKEYLREATEAEEDATVREEITLSLAE